MSSYGEDIIRETFEKFGVAIGVQMQMPDAMITNLGAVLQAQIDLLAELQSTGRLIPAGGRGLEFSEVEALRSAWEELKGYRVDGYARPYVNQMVKVVGALFPATEPAEAAPNLAAVAQEPRRFDPADECQNDNHDPGCMCGAQHWMTTPAPAEPAEEETKAEDGSGWHWVQSAGGYYSGPACTGGYRCRSMAHYEGCLRPSLTASSLVVPAPTETGPWQNRVNGEICVASPASGLPYTIGKFNDHGDFVWHSSSAELPEGFAPFVAAEKG